MELKKSPKADLENKRKIFFELGLIIAIVACLYGFKSSNKVNRTVGLGTLDNHSLVMELPPITRPDEAKPIALPPKVADLILITENDAIIDEDPIIDDTGVDNLTAIYAAIQITSPKEVDKDEEKIFITADEMPEFPGGNLALLNYLNQNVKYPVIAVENGITGKVTVNFVVNIDGTISDARILRGVDPSLDKEALRVVNSLPQWKPGKQSGKVVRVSFPVPINFVLQH